MASPFKLFGWQNLAFAKKNRALKGSVSKNKGCILLEIFFHSIEKAFFVFTWIWFKVF
jgi:hypothetical protein